MVSLINKQLLLTAYGYLFIMEQQEAQQGGEALQLQVNTEAQQQQEDRMNAKKGLYLLTDDERVVDLLKQLRNAASDDGIGKAEALRRELNERIARKGSSLTLEAMLHIGVLRKKLAEGIAKAQVKLHPQSDDAKKVVTAEVAEAFKQEKSAKDSALRRIREEYDSKLLEPIIAKAQADAEVAAALQQQYEKLMPDVVTWGLPQDKGMVVRFQSQWKRVDDLRDDSAKTKEKINLLERMEADILNGKEGRYGAFEKCF